MRCRTRASASCARWISRTTRSQARALSARISRSHMSTSNDIGTTFAKALQFRYQDAHLKIDVADRLALLDSRRLRLTRKEYELLLLLVENAGEVLPREILLMRVWGYCSGIRT